MSFIKFVDLLSISEKVELSGILSSKKKLNKLQRKIINIIIKRHRVRK